MMAAKHRMDILMTAACGSQAIRACDHGIGRIDDRLCGGDFVRDAMAWAGRERRPF